MDAPMAMALLVGVYVGGSFGGSIPAVLIATPGSPEAGMTVLDGNPMARSGKSGKALKTTLYASCAGNFLSAITTTLCIMLIARLALMIGPAEYFSIAVFSIILIAVLGSQGEWIKGLIAGLIGLLVATIGSDPLVGTVRFTFGVRQLMGGVELIPVLIGLFVGAETLSNVRIKRETPKITVDFKHDNKITPGEVKRCIPPVLTGSMIGTVIGALPGLNAAVSSTLNYALAKKMSKHSEEFGHGCIEGIAASEAANNGTVGPSLAPLLTLGIPGTGTAAVFMGALVIQGVQCGPGIMRESSDVVYSILFTLILCTVILLIVGSGLIRVSQFVAFIPAECLGPIVLLTCCAGIYASNKRIVDVFTFLAFLLIGILLKYFKIPLLPLLIAYLLGSMMESNFRRSVLIGNAAEVNVLTTLFFSKISAFFLTISLLLLLWGMFGGLIRKMISKKHSAAEEK
jgi:putative tricarboxylic transport membrane protein